MSILNRHSRLRIKKVEGKCTACGTCNATCDVAAIDHGQVRVHQCQFCYCCVDHCPNGGLQVVDVWAEKAPKEATVPAKTKAEEPT